MLKRVSWTPPRESARCREVEEERQLASEKEQLVVFMEFKEAGN